MQYFWPSMMGIFFSEVSLFLFFLQSFTLITVIFIDLSKALYNFQTDKWFKLSKWLPFRAVYGILLFLGTKTCPYYSFFVRPRIIYLKYQKKKKKKKKKKLLYLSPKSSSYNLVLINFRGNSIMQPTTLQSNFSKTKR